MNSQPKLVVAIVIGICSLVSLTSAATREQCLAQCFDCTLCDYNCHQECDSTFTNILCKLLIQQCKSDHGCNKPSSNITLYPANDFNAGTTPEYQPLVLATRKNCCYDLTGFYDKTLSNIKTNGVCVNLYSGHGCTGDVLKVDTNLSCYKSRSATNVITLDCPARLATGAAPWNDKPSSIRLC